MTPYNILAMVANQSPSWRQLARKRGGGAEQWEGRRNELADHSRNSVVKEQRRLLAELDLGGAGDREREGYILVCVPAACPSSQYHPVVQTLVPALPRNPGSTPHCLGRRAGRW